jgi:hypothetical protein
MLSDLARIAPPGELFCRSKICHAKYFPIPAAREARSSFSLLACL